MARPAMWWQDLQGKIACLGDARFFKRLAGDRCNHFAVLVESYPQTSDRMMLRIAPETAAAASAN